MWLLPRLLRFNKYVCKSVLPPLLRFNKSVCKSWRATTSFFVDRQTTTTTTTTTTSKFGSFILQTTQPHVFGVNMFMLSSSGSGDDDQKKKKVFKLDEDLGFSAIYKDYLLEDTLRMVGSCNGIICLHDTGVMDEERGCTRQHYSNIRDVSLWNPATRQFRILPKMIPIQENGAYDLLDFVALGFDVETKDYKVLRITPYYWIDSPTGGCMCRVQVYSLSTDSWRLLEDINSLPSLPEIPNQNDGIYLNGTSYFFVGTNPYTDDASMLMSFDFTKEIFTTMQLPENVNNRYDNLVLSSLDDKIALFTRTGIVHDCDGGYEYYDTWVLNEQQGLVNSSWTKLHSVRIKYTRGPRCISNNGEFALITTTTGDRCARPWMNKVQLFNLVTNELVLKEFTIGYRDCIAAFVYKENLVSIMGGNVLLRWQLPSHGTTYKLNLDAPFIDSYGPFGIGLCLISDSGGCIGVRSLRRFGYVSDAEEGKALAMLEAIKWAKELKLSPIIIESDSENVVSFFMEDDNDDKSTYWSSEALLLLREAKLLLNSSEIGIVISFQYCSRSCNYVADIAAKLSREVCTWSCKDWTANFPGEIVMSLSKDLGLETQ